MRRMTIESFLRDFRQALRAMARMPMLSAVIILSLAVGIGVNTAVFSWIQTAARADCAALPSSRQDADGREPAERLNDSGDCSPATPLKRR